MCYKTYYLLYLRKQNENCFCENCGNIAGFNGKNMLRFCCKSCANKITTTERHKMELIFNKIKIEETNFKLYGNKHYTNRLKYKETCTCKYGSDNYFNSTDYLLKRKFNDIKKHLTLLNSRLKFGYTMNYNQKLNKIHYHCNLCNRDSFYNHKTFLTRINREQQPCNYCFIKQEGVSSYELELRSYIKKLYKDTIIFNDRNIIHKEIDIYLPKLKLGIEFDGNYWHMEPRIYKSTDFNKNKNLTAEQIWEYDKLKDKLAKNKGITLLHIKEYDWLNDKFKEKEKIKKYIDKC